MPPFRAGLLKRKANESQSKKSESTKLVASAESSESELDAELLRGESEFTGEDATDSEHESAGDESDVEKDEVLFDDDADSLLGDDELGDGTDDSSVLTDSDDDDEGTDEENEAEEDNDSEAGDDSTVDTDSGAESGLSQTPSKEEPVTNKKKTKKKSDSNSKSLEDILEPVKQDKGKTLHGKEQTKSEHKKKLNVKKSDKQIKDSLDILTDKIKDASIETLPVVEKDEYESGDTSDEEERRNTAGAVPAWWYDEYDHVGYDVEGRRLLRPPRRDHIDEFLRRCEDPEFWRTVRDPQTGQDVILSTEDLQLLQRIREGRLPSADHDEYKPWVEWFTREVLATPVRGFPDHKRSFLPSRDEQRRIGRLVHALKMGWSKTRRQLHDERRKRREKHFYNLWGNAGEEESQRGIHRHIPAPRRPPPSHAESYNPPPEYLLDAKEMKEWNKLAATPWKRKYTVLPERFTSLRAVPAYPRYTRERFLRCLDLYLAPRAVHMRLTISPQSLVPSLPSPRDLQPFPTTETMRLRGHTARVRSCDFDPAGQYAVSGSDDRSVRIWEVSTGRCLRTVQLDEEVTRVCWTPVAGLSLVAVAAGARLLLLNPGADVGCHRVAEHTDQLLEEPPPQHDVTMDARTQNAVQWEKVVPEQWARGVRVQVAHFKPLTHVAWHARGDYVVATLEDAASRAVVVHQLSRRRSQLPFTKAKGLVQCAVFHPTRPQLFVATQRVVRIYDLVKQELVKKLLTGAQWISSLAVHPAGDNLLITTYDRKCIWFDLEMSSQPYQTLRIHGSAVRGCAFHARYPLFASGGDDPYVLVSHGMVYNDLLQNPLLVPLKKLPLGSGEGGAELSALQVRFHPAQPWLLAACGDGCLRLYT